MLSLLLLAAAATTPNPYARELRTAAELRAKLQRLPMSAASFSGVVQPALDYRQFDVDVRWDFRTGAVEGTGTVTLRAQSSAAASTMLPLLIDPGMVTFSASDALGPLEVSRQNLGANDYVQVDLRAAPLTTRDEVITLSWSGTLRCDTSGGVIWSCARGPQPFVWMDHGSAIPLPVDPVSGASTDTLNRRWLLRTPLGFTVRAPGTLVSRAQNATELISEWATTAPVSLGLSSWTLTGTELTESASAQTPMVSVSGGEKPEVITWAGQIFEAQQHRFGSASSPTIAQVIIPHSLDFIGSACYATTLLNDDYEINLPVLHEEIWAHENIHQYFGVRAYPADLQRSSLMTEGITTLLQLDYTTRHLSGLERERALARRLREFALQLGYRFPQVASLPLWLEADGLQPTEAYAANAWAYFKGAATHDLLRLYLGEATFDAGLNAYLRGCDQASCDIDTFRTSLETASGRDLRPFFNEWVFRARQPHLSIEWVSESATRVTLTQDGEGLVPLELWLELEDGSLQRESWPLSARSETRSIVTPAPVRRVRVNPRLETVIAASSHTAGDVDFDGEVDGFDLIACSRLVGQRIDNPASADSLWGTNLQFDLQCDRDHDGNISAADLAQLPFNTLRGGR